MISSLVLVPVLRCPFPPINPVFTRILDPFVISSKVGNTSKLSRGETSAWKFVGGIQVMYVSMWYDRDSGDVCEYVVCLAQQVKGKMKDSYTSS